MFVALYSVILLLTLLITKINYTTILKSNILFTGMWCTCAALSSLGLYGLYKPSNIIHFYSITAIFTFNIVFVIQNKIKISNNYVSNLEGAVRFNIIYIANIISWIFLSQYIPKVINIVSMYGYRRLRDYAFDSSLGLATTLELTIIQWFVHSVFVATILIAMIYIVLGRKAPFLKLIAIVDVIFYTLMFGGRYMIVRMLMYYIFAYLIVKSKDLKRLKKKRFNIVLIGTVICSIFILTSQRNWGDTSLIENTFVYYVGSFTFLDLTLNNVYFNGISKPLFGLAIFGFVSNLIIAPFTLLFDFPYRGSNYLITQMTAIQQYISPTKTYNSMTTMLYPFLRDFGYIGIIFGTSFIASFISFAEKKFIDTKHLFFLCIYVYLAFVLFDSVMLYQLLFPSSAITMSLFFIFIKFKGT